MNRLIDLHVDWPLQYAGESSLFDPAYYPGVSGWTAQVDGYLGSTRAAFVACYREAAEWASRADPWRALGDLIAAVEAEFSGRLLIGADDLARHDAEPEGALTWAVVGVEGFDALIREEADLARLRGLFDRGVRLFQPVYGPSSAIGGSAAAGDDRGLTGLGIAFLDALADLMTDPAGARPIVDLAHLNPRAAGEVLGWFEADAARPERILLAYSHGALMHEGFSKPRAITRENLTRLRALGGVVGFCVSPPFYNSTEEIRAGIEAAAAIPWKGRVGPEGIAIGTDFLGVDSTLPTLASAGRVVDWLASTFDRTTAEALIWRNAESLIRKAVSGGEIAGE